MQKTILITGGAGYIGSHCVKDLLLQGYRCVVVGNLSTGHRNAVLSPDFIELDLADRDGLQRVFDKYPIDGVIHFAASTAVGESVSNPEKYYTNNVINSFNLLNAMVANGVHKIVFSSTCAIYGNPVYSPLDEAHPQNPINPYGKSKYITESIFEDYKNAYGLQYITLRYFNVAGCDPSGELGDMRTPPALLIPLALEVAVGAKEHLTIYGDDYDTPDGTCIRDYIHVQDIVSAHRLALENMFKCPESHYINLGTGTGSSVKEIIDSARKITGKTIPAVIGERRPGDPAKLVAVKNKAKEVMGWEPEYTHVEDIIESAWRWMQRQEN